MKATCNQACVSPHVLYRLPMPVYGKRMYDYSFAEVVITVHAFQIFSTTSSVVNDHPHLLKEDARRKLYRPSRHID